MARREERAYREYVSDEQRRQPGARRAVFQRDGVEEGCIGGQICVVVSALALTVPAMLPLYERLQMDKRVLACITSTGGTSALDGTALRASAALHASTTERSAGR